jgi:hypothetical protein
MEGAWTAVLEAASGTAGIPCETVAIRRGLAVLVVLAACGDDAISVSPEANPLGSTNNILPYPSSLYEHPDGRLDVPAGAFPANKVTGASLDPAPLARRRGWPATTTLLWAAPSGVDPAGLVGPDELAASVTADSTTVIVDMTTGDRVAHFAEVDANELDDFSIQAVYVRPAQRLAGGHRYAVGVGVACLAHRRRAARAQAAGDQRSVRLHQRRTRARAPARTDPAADA